MKIEGCNDKSSLQLHEDEDYDTLDGFELAQLDHVTVIGEVIDTEEIRFKTLEASATQIKRLSIEYSIHEE